jgi:hydroxymethylbilane synthase
VKNLLRIGTRGSQLALVQAGQIKRSLEHLNRNTRFEIVIVKTVGDEFQSVELFKKNNVGVFTGELEKQLASGKIDIAVHSLKDVPTDLGKGLFLAAFPKRERAGDVLVSRGRRSLKNLPKGAVVGTGSPRRKRQLALLRPDLDLRDMRGNLDTRVNKVIVSREYDAVVVAHAGLLRLKKYLKHASLISEDDLLPAVGQAALGVEIRRSDRAALAAVRKLNHLDTERRVGAERSLLKALHGGCRVPLGVRSFVKKGKLNLRASVFSVKDSSYLTGEISGAASGYDGLGKRLAARLIKKGAARFLREARS